MSAKPKYVDMEWNTIPYQYTTGQSNYAWSCMGHVQCSVVCRGTTTIRELRSLEPCEENARVYDGPAQRDSQAGSQPGKGERGENI